MATSAEKREYGRKYYERNRKKLLAYSKVQGRRWYKENAERGKEVRATYRKKNKEKMQAQAKAWAQSHKERMNFHGRKFRANLKVEVLSHYGPFGQLKCSWDSCEVIDPDMLSLDHVQNNGKQERKSYGQGVTFYGKLRRMGFPSGYQTLCMNHQWKKELLRKRDN